MNEGLSCNEAGLSILRSAEALRLDAYYCPAGRLTIGWGHTGPDVSEGQVITEDEAVRLLDLDVAAAADAVRRFVVVRLNDNQFSALVSFTFNLGAGSLRGSTLLRCVNAGDMDAAAAEFPKWCHSQGQILAGLVTRRDAEQALFLS